MISDRLLCADGEWIVVQAVEPQFYAELIRCLGLDRDERFVNPEAWSSVGDELSALFKTKSRADWTRLLEGTDTCFAPVLAPQDAAAHPHNIARGIYKTIDGVLQTAPAPRFTVTPSEELISVPPHGAHTRDVLAELQINSKRTADRGQATAFGSTS